MTHLRMKTEGVCPACGEEAWRDSADVGVGTIYGPYGCPCGWSEDETCDQLTGTGGWQDNGSYLDPQGVIWPKDNLVTQMMRHVEEGKQG